MSRDLIEYELKWSWTPKRVLRSIRATNTAVIKARIGEHNLGFGIMSYRKEKANLNLLAVDAKHRKLGAGRKILGVLEHKAAELGIEDYYVQVRESNQTARQFYERFGYEMIDRNAKYYQGIDSSIIYYKYWPR